jgi:hypothetical protein
MTLEHAPGALGNDQVKCLHQTADLVRQLRRRPQHLIARSNPRTSMLSKLFTRTSR